MIVPKQIIIETTSRCNLRCKGCPVTLTGYPAGDMDVDFFKSIVDRIDFPTVAIPWMNGEPLLHPNYTEMVKYITDRKIPTYITTNGHFWREDLFDHITRDTSCYQIILSLDGVPGSASIVKARPGSNPELAVGNIKRFIQLKKDTGATLDVGVKICERGQDWAEIEEYILYWLDEGADYVCVGRMLAEDNVEGMRRYPCQYFDNNFMVIRWDGTLVLCAYNDAVVNGGENPLFKLGSTMPLLEAYNSPAYEFYREAQNASRYPGPCATCGFAYTGMGMDGEVRFRQRPWQKVFIRMDYYNKILSYKDRGKTPRYYMQGSTIEAASDYYERKA